MLDLDFDDDYLTSFIRKLEDREASREFDLDDLKYESQKFR